MRAIDIKVGNEIFFAGELQIATEDAYRASDKGEGARIIYLRLLPVAIAGVRDDGTLEFGQHLGYRHTLFTDPGDIPLVRTDVKYRTITDYCEPFSNPELITKGDLRREREQSMRSELIRVSLRRKAEQGALSSGEIRFRKVVQKSLDAGISVAEIQRETGLSRARIYQIRDNRR